MGYIDKELGIKSAKGLAKYFRDLFGQEIMAIKVPNSVRLIWAVNNKLHTHDIKGSVIYVIKESQLDEAMLIIKNSLNII